MNSPETNDYPWTARKTGQQFCNLHTDYVPSLVNVARWKLGFGPTEAGPDAAANKAYEPKVLPCDKIEIEVDDTEVVILTAAEATNEEFG